MSWLANWFRRTTSVAASPRPRYRPGFDLLEDRITPAGNFVALAPTPLVNLTPPPGPVPSSAAAADFNGDGIPDLAVADFNAAGGTNPGLVNILYGAGNGTYTPGPVLSIGVPGSNLSLAAGRFTSTPGASLEVLDYVNGNLYTFLNAGTALPASPSSVVSLTAAGGAPFSGGAANVITAGDVNGDGFTDVVVGGASAAGTGAIDLMINIGDGSFLAAPPRGLGSSPPVKDLALGKFNADPFLDVATIDGKTGNSIEELNNGGAGLSDNFVNSPTTIAVAPSPSAFSSITSGQLNNDALSDLAVTDPATNTIFVLLASANGSGTFAGGQRLAAGVGIAPNAIRIGDFNGDGVGDLAVLNAPFPGTSGSVSILANNGNGTAFNSVSGSPYIINGGLGAPSALLLGNFTGIGRPDVAVPFSNGAGSGVAVLQNQLVNTFYAVAGGPGQGALVYIFGQSGQLLGEFNPFPSQQFTGGYRVAVGDVNGDGVPDLALTTGPGGQTAIFVYDGKSILANPSSPTAIAAAFAFGSGFAGGAFVAVGNLTGGPGAQIIVSADAGGGAQVNIYSFTNNSLTLAKLFYAFPFTGAGSSFTFAGGSRVAVADVNRDGLADIIVGAGPGAGPQVNVYFGNSTGFIRGTGLLPNPDLIIARAIQAPVGVFTGGTFVDAADFNGDGFADIIVGADAGGGPQVGIFNGAALTAGSGNAQVQGFNGIQPASFTGGMRVGSTLGLDNTGILRRVLITAAGPTGSQLTGFNIFSVFPPTSAAPVATFTAVQFPPPPFAANGNGAYISV